MALYNAVSDWRIDHFAAGVKRVLHNTASLSRETFQNWSPQWINANGVQRLVIPKTTEVPESEIVQNRDASVTPPAFNRLTSDTEIVDAPPIFDIYYDIDHIDATDTNRAAMIAQGDEHMRTFGRKYDASIAEVAAVEAVTVQGEVGGNPFAPSITNGQINLNQTPEDLDVPYQTLAENNVDMSNLTGYVRPALATRIRQAPGFNRADRTGQDAVTRNRTADLQGQIAGVSWRQSTNLRNLPQGTGVVAAAAAIGANAEEGRFDGAGTIVKGEVLRNGNQYFRMRGAKEAGAAATIAFQRVGGTAANVADNQNFTRVAVPYSIVGNFRQALVALMLPVLPPDFTGVSRTVTDPDTGHQLTIQRQDDIGTASFTRYWLKARWATYALRPEAIHLVIG